MYTVVSVQVSRRGRSFLLLFKRSQCSTAPCGRQESTLHALECRQRSRSTRAIGGVQSGVLWYLHILAWSLCHLAIDASRLVVYAPLLALLPEALCRFSVQVWCRLHQKVLQGVA
ncbi:hypothetical protein SISNIDRAFT_304269 [Sistotremastrum niveocremeum HHB9708]|uniref:Uncharacterized protein n=1 Tax=Sistotremastrum niveocremeum HHB9708 TaxID=1314777 RepID=A0A164N5T3_9AGAM|nr:hypothetical protein SISNIDRAFT_304269 [Sistotremastrum niveocremeum HHB9708]